MVTRRPKIFEMFFHVGIKSQRDFTLVAFVISGGFSVSLIGFGLRTVFRSGICIRVITFSPLGKLAVFSRTIGGFRSTRNFLAQRPLSAVGKVACPLIDGQNGGRNVRAPRSGGARGAIPHIEVVTFGWVVPICAFAVVFAHNSFQILGSYVCLRQIRHDSEEPKIKSSQPKET